jgi:uncharacterized protein YhbP (UPF0306 family)
MIDQIWEKAKHIITSNSFMVIATASTDATPWNTPVYYAFDKENTFYWYSGKNTKHSQLITKNKKVAISIFNNSGDLGGVYITGNASEVVEEELPHALETYFNRALPDNPEEKKKMLSMPEDFLGDSVLRMYKVVPEKIYVSGDANKWNGKWIDVREEVK